MMLGKMRFESRLPRCHRTPAQLLLRVTRFSADALLIAADAYRELASHHALNGAPDLAEQAHAIARQLTDEAPRRVVPAPAHVPPPCKGNAP